MMSKLKAATLVAKAIGTISWAADKTIGFSKRFTKNVYYSMKKQNYYDIDVVDSNGVIVKQLKSVPRQKVNEYFDSMESMDFLNVNISIARKGAFQYEYTEKDNPSKFKEESI